MSRSRAVRIRRHSNGIDARRYQQFRLRKALFGYQAKQTDDLLADIVNSFEDVWRDRADLADKIEQLGTELVRYRELEQLLRTTLISAERASQQMTDQTRRETESVLGEARAEAREILREAMAERERLNAEINRIRAQLVAVLGTLGGESLVEESASKESTLETPLVSPVVAPPPAQAPPQAAPRRSTRSTGRSCAMAGSDGTTTAAAPDREPGEPGNRAGDGRDDGKRSRRSGAAIGTRNAVARRDRAPRSRIPYGIGPKIRSWISMSSFSARPARCLPPGAPRPRYSFAGAASGCSSIAARAVERQFLRSTLGLVDLSEIFLTHYHADHYLGLPGMLKTFSLRGRELPLTVYGPPGLNGLFGSLRKIFGRLTFSLDLVELAPGERFERDGYVLETFAVEHGVSALGYALAEMPRPGRFDVQSADALGVPPGRERGALQRGETVSLADGSVIHPEQVLGPARLGRRLVIWGDAAPARAVVEAARDADLLIHEATFCEEELDRAEETCHSTAVQAAEGRASGAREDACANALLDPLLRARGVARSTRSIRGHGGTEGLRYHRVALSGAR